MKAKLTKKTYNLITLEGSNLCLENYNDRTFILRGKFNGYTILNINFDGDEHWEITDENILKAGEAILNEEVKKRQVKPKEPKRRLSERLVQHLFPNA